MSIVSVNIANKRALLGLSKSEMSIKLGISSQLYGLYERGDRNPKTEFYLKWKQMFNEDLNIETNVNTQTFHEKLHSKKLSGSNKNEIQFIDADFSAGNAIEFYDDTQMIQSAYTMDIPEFRGTISFRAYGDSMEPTIKSGSIVFATKIEDWMSHLEYGQIYGIVCIDNRRYLKYIRRSKKEQTHFLLKSENELYDDFELPKDKIKNIWLIHGWLNKRT